MLTCGRAKLQEQYGLVLGIDTDDRIAGSQDLIVAHDQCSELLAVAVGTALRGQALAVDDQAKAQLTQQMSNNLVRPMR